MIKKRGYFFGLCFLGIFFLSGCWNQQEIKHSAIVVGTAFDLTPSGELMVTVEVIDSLGNTANSSSSVLFSANGANLTEALSALSGKMSRPFEWSHNQIIVLGQALAEHGLEHFIDLLNRQYPMRPRIYLLLSTSMGADILKSKIGMETITSTGIAQMLQGQNKQTSGQNDIFMAANFINAYISPSIAPVLPVVAVEGEAVVLKPALAVLAPQGFCRLLNERQTRGIAWLFDLYAGKTMRISDTSGREVALQVQQSQVKWQWDYQNEHLTVRCDVEVKSNVQEMAGSTAQMETAVEEQQLEQKQKEAIMAEILLAWQNNLLCGKDNVGLAREIYRRDYSLWQQIKDRLPQVFMQADLQVEVHNHIVLSSGKE